MFAKRGIDERLPTFPEFSDDENENDDSDDGAVGKKNQEEQNNPITMIKAWFHYWSMFALLRALQVFVSPQFATLLLFINLIVLSNNALGSKLTETLYEATVSPLCVAVDKTIAPKTHKFVQFFNTSFAQAVRGVHTQLITMSIPNASDDLLVELTDHTLVVKQLIETEKRRRMTESLGSSGNVGDSGTSGSAKWATKSANKQTGGLRKRRNLRQSLGLW